MQAVWEYGSIPKQMRWEVIVLLPKGGGDYRGIGLLKPFLEGRGEDYGSLISVDQVP
jgi:hypothetical protein